jgi:plasmid maintenance system antidote protein VapI
MTITPSIPTKDDLDRAFSHWLAAWLQTEGLTQFQAALRFGVTPSTVHNLLKGKKRASSTMMSRLLAGAGLAHQALWPFLSDLLKMKENHHD